MGRLVCVWMDHNEELKEALYRIDRNYSGESHYPCMDPDEYYWTGDEHEDQPHLLQAD